MMTTESKTIPFEWLFLKSEKISFPETLSKPFFTSHWHKLGHITCPFLKQSLAKKRYYFWSVIPIPRTEQKGLLTRSPWAAGGQRGDINKKGRRGTSLVAQWLRILLPMQGTRVRALVREDPTCRGATKPMCPNY